MGHSVGDVGTNEIDDIETIRVSLCENDLKHSESQDDPLKILNVVGIDGVERYPEHCIALHITKENDG